MNFRNEAEVFKFGEHNQSSYAHTHTRKENNQIALSKIQNV